MSDYGHALEAADRLKRLTIVSRLTRGPQRFAPSVHHNSGTSV